MSAKVEFASSEWISYARQAIVESCEGFDLDGIESSFCEEFTDPPAHLSPDGSSLGWHVVVSNGTVLVGAGVLDDADVTITVPYEKVLPYARLTNAEADGPDREEFRRNYVRVTGDMEGYRTIGLPWTGTLHDILALVTA